MSDEKCIVMLSGGLDSRLALKIMQEQMGPENVTALYFNLPFGSGCCSKSCSFNFSQMQGTKLDVIECAKGENLREYLEVIRDADHGRGAGVNACVDCRIFIFKKAKQFADEKGIKMIVTGEVLGERPMSQMPKSMQIIEEKSGLKGRILRPLSAKLLSETDFEKEGLIDRDKLYQIQGRRRVPQMEMADKFKIDYPSPGGGCLMCEKELKVRLAHLLDRGMDEKEILLVSVGRHFLIDGCWIVSGRNHEENLFLQEIGKTTGKLVIPEGSAPTTLILDETSDELEEMVGELIKAYSKGIPVEERERFEEFKF